MSQHQHDHGELTIGPGEHDDLRVVLPFIPSAITVIIDCNRHHHCGGADVDRIETVVDGDTLWITGTVFGESATVRWSARA